MAAITPTEISVEDNPMNLVYGTSQRRVKAYIRGTSTGKTDTINLQTYIPNMNKIECLLGGSLAGSAYATYNSGTAIPANYAGNTITTVTGAGAYEIVASVVMN